ncbi:MAG: hypothetical protein BWY64_00440 [bacterium ADurb.Bin363]|nr:MAG: hypothetical protein BWY64_00440 [bacterium ADurb.Bin363]
MFKHKILADENIDYLIIKRLKQAGFDVISIAEEYRSISDKEILEISLQFNAVLLTEDSDFGEWIFSHRKKAVSVIFLRYNKTDINSIIDTLISVLKKYEASLINKFIVITTKKIRIRDIP